MSAVTTATQFNPEKVRKSIRFITPRYALIRDAFENIACQRSCVLEIIERDVIVGEEMQVFRSAEQKAAKTIVINNGSAKIEVYESECLVAIVQPFNQVTIVQRGTGRIWLRSTAFPQPCVITSYISCECGVPQTEIDYYDRVVGELLL